MLIKKEDIDSVIGQSIGVSEWFEVTQKDVDLFADVTNDHQFIHVDQEKAAQSPFGGTIAHGFFTVSLMSHFAKTGCGISIENAKMGLNYGCDKLRFLHPVPVGSRVRGHGKLLSVVEKRPGEYLFKNNITVEIENIETPALIAEWLTMSVV